MFLLKNAMPQLVSADLRPVLGFQFPNLALLGGRSVVRASVARILLAGIAKFNRDILAAPGYPRPGRPGWPRSQRVFLRISPDPARGVEAVRPAPAGPCAPALPDDTASGAAAPPCRGDQSAGPRSPCSQRSRALSG